MISVVTPCSSAKIHRRFGITHRLHLQYLRVYVPSKRRWGFTNPEDSYSVTFRNQRWENFISKESMRTFHCSISLSTSPPDDSTCLILYHRGNDQSAHIMCNIISKWHHLPWSVALTAALVENTVNLFLNLRVVSSTAARRACS
jgi:hypothetical protein